MRRMYEKLKSWGVIFIIFLVIITFLPLSLIALERSRNSPKPRTEIIPDMDEQETFKAQAVNLLFADGRAMRPQVPGTIPYRDPRVYDHYYRGVVKEWDGEAWREKWAEAFPPRVKLTNDLIIRGRERYDIYCSACHGYSGYGDGAIARRAVELEEVNWTPPSSFHSDSVLARPVGHIFNTITNGIRKMPSYASQVAVEDRWAIIAYVRALQHSQRSFIEDVPEDVRLDMESRAKDAEQDNEVPADEEPDENEGDE